MTQHDPERVNSESSESNGKKKVRRPWVGIVLAAFITCVMTIVVLSLLTSIFQRKIEAKNPFVRLVEVDETTTDPAPWGQNWSREYDGYLRTVDQTHTR